MYIYNSLSNWLFKGNHNHLHLVYLTGPWRLIGWGPQVFHHCHIFNILVTLSITLSSKMSAFLWHSCLVLPLCSSSFLSALTKPHILVSQYIKAFFAYIVSLTLPSSSTYFTSSTLSFFIHGGSHFRFYTSCQRSHFLFCWFFYLFMNTSYVCVLQFFIFAHSLLSQSSFACLHFDVFILYHIF